MIASFQHHAAANLTLGIKYASIAKWNPTQTHIAHATRPYFFTIISTDSTITGECIKFGSDFISQDQVHVQIVRRLLVTLYVFVIITTLIHCLYAKWFSISISFALHIGQWLKLLKLDYTEIHDYS